MLGRLIAALNTFLGMRGYLCAPEVSDHAGSGIAGMPTQPSIQQQ